MGPGFFYYHRGPDGPQIRRALLLLAISGLLAFALYAGAQMRPLLGSLATTRVSNAVNRIVYQAVNEAIDSGQIAYEQLVSYEKDNEGRITMVRSNMAAFNRLQSQILDLILGRIDQVSARELSIPVGSLTGSPLLAGRGPRISVRMESVGSSSARFENQFESAGINQTKHRIVLRIDVYVSILLPGYSTVTQVTNEITVAETVIVGEVPGTYTYFATDPDLCRRRQGLHTQQRLRRTLHGISHGVCRLQGRTGLSPGLSYGTGVSLLCFRRAGDPGL